MSVPPDLDGSAGGGRRRWLERTGRRVGRSTGVGGRYSVGREIEKKTGRTFFILPVFNISFVLANYLF